MSLELKEIKLEVLGVHNQLNESTWTEVNQEVDSSTKLANEFQGLFCLLDTNQFYRG